jgi:hypothetical protein
MINTIYYRTVVAFGGGLNSTAMIFAMLDRNVIPDLILFADTKAEKPDTYAHIEKLNDYLARWHGLRIATVTEPGPSLEEDCLTRHALPGIAYGFKSCSDRFKQRPQRRFLEAWLKPNERACMMIGFDAGEEYRQKESGNERYVNRFPLIEWKIDREECERICAVRGFTVPKSSCFFCPSSKKREILKLAHDHPDLAARAVAMEQSADLTSIKGLGRHFSWRDVLEADAAQLKLLPDFPPEVPCECFDGAAL